LSKVYKIVYRYHSGIGSVTIILIFLGLMSLVWTSRRWHHSVTILPASFTSTKMASSLFIFGRCPTGRADHRRPGTVASKLNQITKLQLYTCRNSLNCKSNRQISIYSAVARELCPVSALFLFLHAGLTWYEEFPLLVNLLRKFISGRRKRLMVGLCWLLWTFISSAGPSLFMMLLNQVWVPYKVMY